MCKFGMGNHFRLRCGIVPTEDVGIHFDFLIDVFHFSGDGEVISKGFSCSLMKAEAN